MSMSEQLTQEEADRLISMLKEALIEQINAPDPGERIYFDVKGDTSHDLFNIDIFRGRKALNKVNYNARIKINNVTLLELHINATNRHRNPDGEVITGSHWHIYKEGFGTSFAFPALELSDKDFVENAIAFLKKFNVIKRPKITEQTEMKYR